MNGRPYSLIGSNFVWYEAYFAVRHSVYGTEVTVCFYVWRRRKQVVQDPYFILKTQFVEDDFQWASCARNVSCKEHKFEILVFKQNPWDLKEMNTLEKIIDKKVK